MFISIIHFVIKSTWNILNRLESNEVDIVNNSDKEELNIKIIIC